MDELHQLKKVREEHADLLREKACLKAVVPGTDSQSSFEREPTCMPVVKQLNSIEVMDSIDESNN